MNYSFYLFISQLLLFNNLSQGIFVNYRQFVRLRVLVQGHGYSSEFFLKNAIHYDNFYYYCLGIAKPVVGISANVAEPDYDVIK